MRYATVAVEINTAIEKVPADTLHALGFNVDLCSRDTLGMFSPPPFGQTLVRNTDGGWLEFLSEWFKIEITPKGVIISDLPYQGE